LLKLWRCKTTWAWYFLALVVVIFDQWTKTIATEQLIYAEPVRVLSLFNLTFNYTLLHNTGAAFSFLSEAGGWQRWFFGIIAAAVSMLLAVWIAKLQGVKRWEACALALVLGGAIGNLYDRIALGYVVDFIALHYRGDAQNYGWPAFNIADSAICIGAVMLLWDMFFGSQASSKKSAQSQDSIHNNPQEKR